MSFLAGLNTTAQDIKVEDKLGSGGNFEIPTGLYNAKITAAYLSKTNDGAVRAEFEFSLDSGQKHSQGYTVVDKDGNHIITTEDGTRKFLAGFLKANSIAFLACKGTPISNIPTQDKTINVRNYETNQDEPKQVQQLTDMIGKEVCLGIIQQAQFKRVKGNDGKWTEDNTQTQVKSTIHTVFHSVKHFTYAEADAAIKNNTAPESKFYDAWKEEWHDTKRVQDFTKGAYLNKAAEGTKSMNNASPAAATPVAPVVAPGASVFD